MQPKTKAKIAALVLDKVEEKLRKYKQETEHKPFFEAIFSLENIYTASIMHSFYTTYGMSFYEQIALILAEDAGWKAQRQYKLMGTIDQQTILAIEELCRKKSTGKAQEIELIRQSIQPGSSAIHPEMTVDVFIKRPDGYEMYIDITTVKSNLKEFRGLRRKMLNWVALRLSQDSGANVNTFIGIPYNPYHPNPYSRWTGLENDPAEILIQEDLWNAFAGYNVYSELIDVFNEAGATLREKVSAFIKNKGQSSSPPTLF